MSYSVIPKFTALIRDDVGGDMDIELVWSIAGTAGVKFQQDLTAGAFNTINFPSCSLLAIVPPTNNTLTTTLKGATGDTGIVLQAAVPTVLSVFGITSIGITLSAGSTQTFTFIAI
jgi:hypothetical protein